MSEALPAILAALGELDDRAEVVAACDADPALVEKRKGEWGLDRVTTDYRELCESPDIDAVIIATPNFTHHDMAVAAARGGKHVMCEKPFTMDAAQAEAVLAAAAETHS